MSKIRPYTEDELKALNEIVCPTCNVKPKEKCITRGYPVPLESYSSRYGSRPVHVSRLKLAIITKIETIGIEDKEKNV